MPEAQQKAPAELKTVANFLRNKSGMKLRTGALAGKRVDYFKGRSAVKAILSPAFTKLTPSVPLIENEAAAIALLHSLIPHTFFLRVERGGSVSGPGGPKLVQITPQQLFAPDEYYVWLMDANPVRQMAMAFGMVAVVLAAVMFPLWPAKMRVGVWYLSIGVLGLIGLFFAIAVVRLIFWIITIVVAKPGIWIFPNLFADVGFVDSFIPAWGWDVKPEKKVKGVKKAKKAKKDKSGDDGHGHSHGGGGCCDDDGPAGPEEVRFVELGENDDE